MATFVSKNVMKWIYEITYFNNQRWNYAGILHRSFVLGMNCIIFANLSQKAIKPRLVYAWLLINAPISIDSKSPLLFAYHRLVPMKTLIKSLEIFMNMFACNFYRSMIRVLHWFYMFTDNLRFAQTTKLFVR